MARKAREVSSTGMYAVSVKTNGKVFASEELIAAKVLSGTACDLTENPVLLEEIQAEFRENQEKHS